MDEGRHDERGGRGDLHRGEAVDPTSTQAEQKDGEHAKRREPVIPDDRPEEEAFLPAQHHAAMPTSIGGVRETTPKALRLQRPDRLAAIGTKATGAPKEDVRTKSHPPRLYPARSM